MSHVASVRVTVTVDVEPHVAFAIFTEEFDRWYQRGGPAPVGRTPPEARLRFEPGLNGRLLQVEPGTPPVVLAHITLWRPGRRLAFVDHRKTEVDITFAPTADGGTRVELEHRGLDQLPPGRAANIAKYGWRQLAERFEAHLTHSPTSRSP